MVEIISQDTARGPYSTVVRAGAFVYLSGQGAIDPATGQAIVTDIETETALTIRNITSLLERAGLTTAHLVQMTCYLTDLSEWERMNVVYADLLGPDVRPTRTAVGVQELPFGLRLEITAVAYDPRVAVWAGTPELPG